MRKNTVLTLFALTALGLQAAPPQAPAPLVAVQQSVEVQRAYAKKYAGQIMPFEEVAVIPRITGTIQKIHFKEGDLVKKGSLLFELEDVTYRAKADSAKASVDQINAEKRYFETNYKRQHTLRKSNAVAQSVFEEAEEKLATINAKLLAAKAELRDAENTLSYTKIHAPITGRIGKCLLTPGNLVTPSTGTLVTITMIAPIHVQFSVGERVFRTEFGGMKGFPNQADIKVELADGVEYAESAKVDIIDPKVDRTTNTLMIWGKFENKNNDLLPGSYVTVLLRVKNPGKLAGILPSALQIDKQGPYVYVLGPNQVPVRRPIVPGNVNGDILEIKQGLVPGETVVVDGMHKIRPGVTAVQPVPYKK